VLMYLNSSMDLSRYLRSFGMGSSFVMSGLVVGWKKVSQLLNLVASVMSVGLLSASKNVWTESIPSIFYFISYS
jgi:hypothetical protein